MDAQTQALLQAAVREESRSFLQYIAESFPWTTDSERAPLAQFQKLAAADQEATAALSLFLARARVQPPYLGPFPMSFTNLNYISLEHLLPMLVKEERATLAARQRDLAQVLDPEVRAHLLRIIDLKKQHLLALESMAAAHPETFSTVR